MSSRNTMLRVGAAVVIVALAVAVYALRPAADASAPVAESGRTVAGAALPRLLDLGADKCVPCKMMAPILDKLKADYDGIMTVEFVDVWKDPAAAKPYDLQIIPTQIFFAPDGTELFRHEGFLGRDDILAKWRELGIDLPEKGA